MSASRLLWQISASKVIAIDAGSRELGIAVFDGDELRYYAVSGIAKRKPAGQVPAEAVRIVCTLIREHQPLKLALAQPIVIHPAAERLAHVLRAIKKLALDEGLTLQILSPKSTRQFICSSERATKKETVERLCAIYPELARYAEGRSHWERLYYEPMFNAVALGLTCVLNSESKVPASGTGLEVTVRS